MLGDFFVLVAGLAILAATFALFWTSLPRPNGPPRWFIGNTFETAIAIAITIGVVLGIGAMLAGILPALGVK
jgi:hypothetical protein